MILFQFQNRKAKRKLKHGRTSSVQLEYSRIVWVACENNDFITSLVVNTINNFPEGFPLPIWRLKFSLCPRLPHTWVVISINSQYYVTIHLQIQFFLLQMTPFDSCSNKQVKFDHFYWSAIWNCYRKPYFGVTVVLLIPIEFIANFVVDSTPTDKHTSEIPKTTSLQK